MQLKETSPFLSGSGIPIQRVYGPKDTAGVDYARDLGEPGEAPFTRGIYPNMYRGKLWTIRRYSGFGTPRDTNQLYRREFELGQTGISIAFDSVTESGLDSDDPRAEHDVGAGGVPVDSLLDMEEMFEGIPIEKVSTAIITQTLSSPPIHAMYFALAEKRGLDVSRLDGTTQADLTTALGCLQLIDQVPPAPALRLCIDLIEWCCQVAPRWHPVSFDSYNYRENAANAYQELGLLLATAIGYIEEARRRGRVPLEKFVRPFSFNMGCHNDFFEEIAKFRAGRRMWYKILHDRYGVTDPRCLQFRFHAQSSGCTHTYQEPLNNLMRIAYQVMACALGGAQSVHANGYDEGLCLPTEESMLLSIRTEQILQHETNIINTADPLGGSYYIEWLTSEVERRTWEYIKQIEDMGGIVRALETGWVHREFKNAFWEYENRVNRGEVKVVGVNTFQLSGQQQPQPVPIFRPNPQAAQVQKEKLLKLRRERDNARVEKALQGLEAVSRSSENVMPAVMEAAKAYATLGEICGVWRKLWGIWRYPMGV